VSFCSRFLLNLFIFYIDSVKILELAARCNTNVHVISRMVSLLIRPTNGNHLLNLIHENEKFKDDLICNAKKLLYKVVQRFQSNEGLRRFIDAQPEDHMVEYAKFLTLKVVCGDTNSRLLSPTAMVDKIWHAHILSNLDRYIEDCAFALVANNAAYWLTQPKCIYINHRHMNQEEAKLMLFTFKQIEAIVWPVARVTKKRKSMNACPMSDDDSEVTKKRKSMNEGQKSDDYSDEDEVPNCG
jgi:hypothetical protein